MNRRSFLTRVLAVLAAAPFIGGLVKQISQIPIGGTFSFTDENRFTTRPIRCDATAEEIEAALNELPQVNFRYEAFRDSADDVCVSFRGVSVEDA